MVIMVCSMDPLVVSMVPMQCSPMLVILGIKALILRVMAEVVVLTNLVHNLIKFILLLVLAFLVLTLTFVLVKSIAKKVM